MTGNLLSKWLMALVVVMCLPDRNKYFLFNKAKGAGQRDMMSNPGTGHYYFSHFSVIKFCAA